jgi:uncharacterized protein YggE
MKKALMLAAFLVAVSAFAQTPPHTLTITGVGRAAVVYDRATFTATITTYAATSVAALNENNERTARVVAALKARGVTEAELETEAFTINEVSPAAKDKSRYAVGNTVTVTRSDFATMGELVKAAVDAGATQVQGVQQYASDSGLARDAALKNAYNDARARAEKLAAVAGQTLGPAIAMTVEEKGPDGTMLLPYFEVDPEAEKTVPVMHGGTPTLTESIKVTFELK